jgi:hypothetical protein
VLRLLLAHAPGLETIAADIERFRLGYRGAAIDSDFCSQGDLHRNIIRLRQKKSRRVPAALERRGSGLKLYFVRKPHLAAWATRRRKKMYTGGET